ncbi:T9SS type A sorting domain-containing protein [bacterium]|nr:T9SS type A sorting domain-containing protein [bacterium]
MPRYLPGALVAALAALVSPVPGHATEWAVTHGRVTFSLSADHLENLGLSVVAAPHELASVDARELGMSSGTLYSFETAGSLELTVRTDRGRVVAIEGDPVPFAGGLLVSVRDPASGAMLPPLALLDFAMEIDPDLSRDLARFVVADPGVDAPLRLRSGGFALEAGERRLRLRLGDLLVSREWADRIGRPALAGELLGGVDVRLDLLPLGPVPADEFPSEPAPLSRSTGGTIDVMLGELYGMTPAGRIGTYPDGVNGLTAATTSCNNGDTNVPWNAPMAETHPFIGLALFRVQDGVLEQIGRNWIKHGWFAVANDQCSLGCVGGGGTYLAIGCSDTYDAFNNAERFFLGPREEVNPHTGSWTACGSYFDAIPEDCLRDYFGAGHDAVEHRVEVLDADLGLPGASYFYEGAYYVADDDTVSNNIGWRECTMTWTGTNWSFDSVPPFSLTPEPGPVISTWGDMVSSGPVAPDDGLAFLAVKTTDLGGGQWHYEYALYNRTSDRAIHSFSVPVGTANLTNIGFHDIDEKAVTDWTATVADGRVTWATDDYATDPDAPALKYQAMFNFRFDADVAPVAAQGLGLLFKPGIGTAFALDTMAPATDSATGVAGLPAVSGLRLDSGSPNPFADRTRIHFSLPAEDVGRLSVLDVSGRVVRVLMDGRLPAGESVLPWDGRDAAGERVASGVYFLRLEAGDEVRTTKTTLLR